MASLSPLAVRRDEAVLMSSSAGTSPAKHLVAGPAVGVEQGIAMISRRRFVVGLTSGLGLGGPVAGQDRPKIIGVLSPYSSAEYEPARELFSRSMLDLHYVSGKHFSMVERLADGQNERLRGLAEEHEGPLSRTVMRCG